jgi:hypothetical protein
MASTSMGWYQDIIKVSPIVMEASSPDDKKYMETMNKDDIHQINGTLIQGLYRTILERKDCDFGDIPASKGDIEKCKYYKSTAECLDVLGELMVKNEIPTTDVDIIKEAIANVKRFKATFALAFDLNQDYLILFYNTIVMAIVDATSMVIAEYMNYLVGPEQSKYDSVKSRNDKSRGRISLDNLQRFNNEVKVGHFDTMANYMLESQRKNFTGTGIVIAGVVVVALVSIVPITRELIYFYYRSKVKLSDYLSMQADFLELNKLGVQASNKTAQQKKEIIRKQEKIILKLRRRADKLKINDEDIGALAKKQVETDNKQFSLKNIEKQMFTNKMDGASFSIV